MEPVEATSPVPTAHSGSVQCPRCQKDSLAAQWLPSGFINLECLNADCGYSQDLRVHTPETQAPSGSTEDHFQALSELPPLRPEAPSLPPDLLPGTLRPWLVDVTSRMQVALELAAIPAIVGLAAVVGRRVGIHPKAEDNWLVVPNLWGGIIARPGMLKSPTLAEALQPIRRLAKEARVHHEQVVVERSADLDCLKLKEAGIKNRLRQTYEGKGKQGATETELQQSLLEVQQQVREQELSLIEPRYVVNDTTIEKLGELLKHHPRGLLLERDELAGWLRSLEREDRKGDREFFLEAWNGLNPYTWDRIGRGTIHLPALCLSIVGGIQPAKLSRYVSEALEEGYAADGLLQRFQLLVWPQGRHLWQLVDQQPDQEALSGVCGVFSALAGIEAQGEDGDGMVRVRFAEEAQELFYEWLGELEGRLRSPELQKTPAFESHLAKYRSLMPTLALLFHLVETIGSSSDSIEPVSLDAAKLAADWCEYLEIHARKVYAAEIQDDVSTAHALAAKIQKGEIYDGMTVREVYRRGWARVNTSELAWAGLAVLESHGWVRIDVPKRNGRPSPVVRVNPALRERPS